MVPARTVLLGAELVHPGAAVGWNWAFGHTVGAVVEVGAPLADAVPVDRGAVTYMSADVLA